MAIQLAKLKPSTNEVLLDRIRNDGSSDYQRRIPEATKAGVQVTLRELQNNRPLYNEFLDQLVNRIGLVVARTNSWTNPLAEFKTGMLPYGDTIEEIHVGLIKARSYSKDREALEKDIFGTHRSDVEVNFHKVNREDMYPLTINEPLLHRAFLEQGGLQTFIGQLMASMQTSDNWDEFLLMCSLFSEYEANGGFHKVQVPDVANFGSTEADAKTTLRTMRGVASNLKFMSTRYNAAGRPMSVNPEDLVVFCTPEFKAAIDVEALAAAFNLSYAEAYGRFIEIPSHQMNIDGAQAIMTSKEFFVIGDQRLETTSAWNPVALQSNYFLHHWQVISASRFVPSVLFTTHRGDDMIEISTPVTSVTTPTVQNRDGETVTTVQRGEVYALDAKAVTDPADGVNDGVRWSVTGNSSLRTYTTTEGTLHVGTNEDSATIKVTATSTWLDPDNVQRDGKTASIDLTVTGESSQTWPEKDDAVTMIQVKGTDVPGFTSGVYTYDAVPVEGGTVKATDIKVTGDGITASDAKVTISNAGKTATIEVATAPGDPVYTINVVAA